MRNLQNELIHHSELLLYFSLNEPKLDTRAAIFKDNKILLVEENDGTWSMPGGWVDVMETVKSLSLIHI